MLEKNVISWYLDFQQIQQKSQQQIILQWGNLYTTTMFENTSKKDCNE